MRLAEFDSAFAATELGPTPAAEVVFIGRGESVPGGMTDFEAWVLCVPAKRAARAFEFGTCTGKTAYLWARNAPPEARIITLTLAPEQAKSASYTAIDNRRTGQQAEEESRFARYLYTATEVECRIAQMYGDSKDFDETPYLGRCDLLKGTNMVAYCAPI